MVGVSESATATEWDYDSLVENGAALVANGHMNVADLDIPSYVEESAQDPDFTAEQLREDVRAFLEEHNPDPDNGAEEDDVEKPNTGGVDWDALWSVFGFDSPDVRGSYVVSQTQLTLALQATDQAVTGDPRGLIDHAVDEGVLKQVEAEGAKDETLTRGYALQRGGDA